ncbi:MAG: hypothetical protein U5J95_06385 [Balneolaceae bacterium]|nr:hypothetical protein [Balneolaceae bacterium]
MEKYTPRGNKELFLETKLGIVTRTGQWFHTTQEAIEEFAPGLLQEYDISTLIKDALAWVRSADSLSLTLLMILLFLVNPWLAALATLSFHWIWYNFKSSLVNRFFGKLFSYMNKDAYLLVIAFTGLSMMGIQEQYLALGIGVIFFFLLKIGLLNMLWDRLSATNNQRLSLNDRVLKMVIIKYAIYEGIAPPSVQTMEDKMWQMTMRRKKGKD